MGKKKLNRDLALKVLDVVGAVKDALDDLLDSMFIIYQPVDYVGAVGTQAVFTVTAMNVASYQWERSQDGGETWENAGGSGNQTQTLKFNVSNSNKGWNWRCRLTDSDSNNIYTNVVGITIPR